LKKLALDKKSVHIWWSNLDQPQDVVERSLMLLNPEELNKFNRFRTCELRNRQIMSRAILRKILSFYLEINASEVKFIFNKFGKPFISSDIALDQIKFNVSHSENIGIFAFSLNDLGIDIERIKEYIEIDGIKEICFTDFEKRWYEDLKNEFQLEAFYKIWTIKEAFIKAIGEGFSYPTLNIELTNKVGDQIQIKKIYSKEFADTNYKVNTFSCVPGFISSIVYEGEKQIRISPISTLNEMVN
jgi:4'-phosphopantetheinyl transferase